MENNYEVLTTTDKAKRDKIYQDLKNNGDELERKVVKFSGAQPVETDINGEMVQGVRILPNYAGTMNKPSKYQKARGINVAPQRTRPMWVSTWSLAYPRS